MVRTSDGNERKLYLQVIFAAMFIEQKHGWSDILSGMPVFGIRESKKRIVEFVLGLDTLKKRKRTGSTQCGEIEDRVRMGTINRRF